MRAGWADVDAGRGEPGDRADQMGFGLVGDVVRLGDGESVLDGGVDVGSQPVADPTHAQLSDAHHARDAGGRDLDLVDQGRVDGVEEAGPDLAQRGAQHPEDGDGDDEADDRVGDRPAERHAVRPEEHRKAGEPVGAGVEAVGDEGGAADPPSDADALAGDDLVPAKPTIAATTTAHRSPTWLRWTSRSIASQAARPEESVIMAMTKSPATSSARP